MLAGEFTGNSLEQLRSNGFTVLHVSYRKVIDAFAGFGIDVFFEEDTADAHLERQIERYEALTDNERRAIGDQLREAASSEIEAFMAALSMAILRRIESVSILPLHGSQTSVSTVRAAIKLLVGYTPPETPGALIRFEVVVRYDNGDRIVADFENAADAIVFLESFD